MIVGFSIKQVNAEKHSGKQGDIDINHAFDITSVEEAEVPAIDEPIARIGFDMDVTYTQDGEDVANMGFAGTVLWQGDAEDVISHWDEEEELTGTVATAVTNHILRKCVTQAVSMADALDIPSPIPMPRVNQ